MSRVRSATAVNMQSAIKAEISKGFFALGGLLLAAAVFATDKAIPNEGSLVPAMIMTAVGLYAVYLGWKTR